MKLLHPFLCILCLAAYLYAKAQPPELNFKRITSKDGLSGDIVYCVLQDRQGFLWVGTHHGLNRYDGYRFIHYNYDPSDTNSLSGNHVPCIKEDANGILWISTNKGLNSLNPVTGKIKRYELPNSMLPSSMDDIYLVNDSILLINANIVVYRFNKITKQFTAIKLPNHERAFVTLNAARFAKDLKERIFLGSAGNDCIIIDWKEATAAYLKSREPLNVHPVHDTTNPISQIYFDSHNNAWCFTQKETLLTKWVSGKKINYSYSSSTPGALESLIRFFYEEPGKVLWICTGAGLVLYDYIQNNFYRYTQKPGQEESLSNNRTTCILRDKNGAYWVGTFGSGLCYFTVNSKFKNIVIDTTLNSEDRIVYGLRTLHSGRILIGTFSRKKFLLNKEKKFVELGNPKGSITMDSAILEITGKPRESFSEDNYRALHGLFKGQALPGLRKYNIATKDLYNGWIQIDEQNNVWFTNRFELIGPNKSVQFNQEITDIAIAHDNHLLIATSYGLLLFNKKNYSIEANYLYKKNNPYSIGSNSVGAILPDGKGNYWVATADAGLDFWDTKTNRFYHYTTKNGLPDNTIYAILPDNHGRLWMSTNNGLSCFDTATKTFTNYDRSDGLINTEYNSGSACIDRDGYMHFGGMNGIDYFHPDSLLDIKQPPSLYISEIKVYNEGKAIASSYQLGTSDNNITIAYTANDFLNASDILYRYKLKGVDRSWNIDKGVSTTSYNKLPPGKYNFHIQASYDGKNWGKPLVIDFSIATPWYQAWWFYALLALFAGLGIQVLFRYRLQQKLKILQVRNRIHRDLHDDVGATLSSVKAYSEILKDNPGNPVIAELIEENATEMIERLEVIAWAANPQHDSFGSLMDKINRYAAPVCTAKHMRLNISTDGVSRDALIPGEVRQNIFLVAKEAINNAIKYSDAQNCSISSFISGGKFVMEIFDDGNGFDGLVNGSGNGLQNMRARIKEIGGEIIITSAKGEGAKIQIQLSYPFKTPTQFSLKKSYR